MDIKQLSLFLSLSENQSFTKTANEYYLTQPMVTKSIKKLEDELGVQLIARTSKSFELTDAGQALQILSRDIISRFNDIYKEIGDIKNLNTGNVTIAGPPATMATFLPSFLQTIHTRFPNLNISLLETGSKNIIEKITTKSANIGILQLPISDPEIITYPILHNHCVLLVNKLHRFVSKTKISIAELKDEHFITLNEQFVLHDIFMQACYAANFTPRIAYKSTLISFIIRLVSMNEGVAILPLPLLEIYPSDYTVAIPLQEEIAWDVALIINKNRYQSIATKKVLKLAQEYFNLINASHF